MIWQSSSICPAPGISAAEAASPPRKESLVPQDLLSEACGSLLLLGHFCHVYNACLHCCSLCSFMHV